METKHGYLGSFCLNLAKFNKFWLFRLNLVTFGKTYIHLATVATLALARDQGKGVARLRAYK
jgi:hypothetical protein